MNMDDDYATNDYRRFLRIIGEEEGVWGYPIYRTYTQLDIPLSASSPAAGRWPEPAKDAGATGPGSATTGVAAMIITDREGNLDADAQWQPIVDSIKGTLEDYLGTFPAPYDEKIRWRLHIPAVHLPGASMDDVRNSLRESRAAHIAQDDDTALDCLAIMVDAEVAASVLAGREPSGRWVHNGVNVGYAKDEEAGVVLKVLDGTYDAGEEGIATAIRGRERGPGDLVYHGWMKVTPTSLHQLQMDIQSMGLARVFKGPDFIYGG